jgi:hypothetical protein
LERLWDANDACRYTTKTSDVVGGDDVILDLSCIDVICVTLSALCATFSLFRIQSFRSHVVDGVLAPALWHAQSARPLHWLSRCTELDHFQAILFSAGYLSTASVSFQALLVYQLSPSSII